MSRLKREQIDEIAHRSLFIVDVNDKSLADSKKDLLLVTKLFTRFRLMEPNSDGLNVFI